MSQAASDGSDYFGRPDLIVEEPPAERIAAICAALDPDRRALQHDVLVSGVTELLYRRPGMSVSEVTTSSRGLWRTAFIGEPLVERALHITREANVSRRSTDSDGVERWYLTEPARLIAEADHSVGDSVTSEFTAEVAARLSESTDPRIDATKGDRVARIVMCALAESIEDLYEVTGSELDLEHLRPVGLDVRKALQIVRERTSPQSVSDAAAEITLAAIDPDDEFGSRVVHLLTVGTILHGFATRRDLPARPSLEGHRVVVDTSVLVGLASPPGTLDRRIVENLILWTLEAGVEVVVPDHVVDEWDRLWANAEGEVGAIITAEVGVNGRLLQNPFARYFLSALEDDARLEWRAFETRNRNLRQRLLSVGVTVRPAGNSDETSRRLAEEIANELFERTRDSRRRRTRSNADADGQSIAMVHRWRMRSGATSAFFVSRGTLPGRVYSELIGSRDVPVETNPETWLLYLATMCTDDPAERSRVAEMVADSAIRQSFFGIAASYTGEDVVALSRRLTDNGGPATIEDSRAALQLDLLGLFGEVDADDPTLERRVSAIVQRRHVRSTTRLARGQSNLDARIAAVRDEASNAVSAERTRANNAEDRGTSEAARADLHRRGEVFWRRIAIGAVPAVLAVLAIVAIAIAGWVHPFGLAVAVGMVLLYVSHLVGYASDPDATVRALVLRTVTELAALSVIEFGIGWLLRG